MVRYGTMEDEIMTWKCDKCGKEIKSMYLSQFFFLRQQHIWSHNKDKIEGI